MALPVVIPNTFANANASIPLSQLDNNFSTVAVAINGMANGAESLSNVNITGGAIGNVTLSNVSISSGNVTINVANVTTLDATNIEVTNIKAKDGTASIALADSTGVASFTANPILSGGTANGVLYLNASKVATSGSALVFDGTNLGIGTSSPQTKFDVKGTTDTHVGITAIGIDEAIILAYDDIGIRTPNLNYAAASHKFLINNTESMTLNASGNLGIGTSSPGYKLDVRVAPASGGAAGAGVTTGTYEGTILVTGSTYFTYGVGPNTAWLYSATNNLALGPYGGSGVIQFVTGGAERMRLDSSGNLGIGTASPGYKLDVRVAPASGGTAGAGVSTGTYEGTILVTGSTYNNYGVGANTAWLYSAANNLALGPYGGSGVIQFVTGGAERARITSGGDFQTSSGRSIQVGGTAARATTAGTNRLDIFNGTAPVGTLTNGISIYSSSGEAYVMDAAGNATLFSPHDADTNEWIFKSKHTPTGKVLKIDVERLLKFVNDHFGLDAVHEFIED